MIIQSRMLPDLIEFDFWDIFAPKIVLVKLIGVNKGRHVTFEIL